jgi:heme/copper-type cytochrome/quinol oxidase subunit 2
MADRRQPLKSTATMVVHIVLILFGWIVFFLFWAKVLWHDTETAKHAGLLILIGLLATPLITLVWVTHNKWIYRRKGARGAGFSPPEKYENDWSGKSVFAEWPLLKTTRNVEVIPVETAKLYKPFKRISEASSRGPD